MLSVHYSFADTMAPIISYLLSDTIKSNVSHTVPILSDDEKQEYLDAINMARSETQDCGVHGTYDPAPPLEWSDALYKAAYEHAQDMVKSNTFSHDGSGERSDWTAQYLGLERGSTMKERIEHNAYKNWKHIGENITAGTYRDTAQEAVDSWLNSDGHCANLMNPDFTEVGLAHVYGADTKYSHYWSQELGSRQ